MTNSITISDLSKVVKDSNLPTSKAEALEAAFMPFFEQAALHCETAFTIKVTNIAQTAEMAKAKKAWKELKDSRIAKESKRKQVKEDALLEGRTIDKIANFLDSVTVPMEKYLEDQWKYGERLRQKMQAEQRDLRTCEAGELIRYFPSGVDLGTIADEEFARYLHLAKIQAKAIQEETERVERERIEKEQREAAEKEAMRVENERLKAEAAKVEAKHAEERERMVKAMREQEAEIAAVREKEERLRREAEEKERLRIQAEQRVIAEQRAKELQAKAAADAERFEKEQAEKAALEAPDKEKLLAYARLLLELPQQQFSTESGAEKFEMAAKKIREAIQILQS